MNPRLKDAFISWITVARCITLEGWTEVLYVVYQANHSVTTFCYFISLVILGGYYFINLFLAVIYHVFSQKEQGEARSRAADTSGSSSAVLDANEPLGDATVAPGTNFNASAASLVEHPHFGAASMGLILLNTLVMMCDRYPISSANASLLELANTVFTLIFAAEMFLKISYYGCGAYWGDAYNRFDGTIVLMSLMDVVSTYVDTGLNSSFLRALRLLRIIRLLRSWRSLQQLMGVLGNIGAGKLLWLICLLGLVLFVFALLGMELFGLQYEPPDFPTPPRHNFDSFSFAMLTVFIITSGERCVWRA